MNTLYQLAQAYFALRRALARLTSSPFVRTAALLGLAVLVWRALNPAEGAAPHAAHLAPAGGGAALTGGPRGAQGGAPRGAPGSALGGAGEDAQDGGADAASAPTAASGASPSADILLAWSVLTAPRTGGDGQRLALEALYAGGADFTALDLSCHRAQQPAGAPCGARLQGLRLTPLAGRGAAFEQAQFRGADLRSAALSRAAVGGAGFQEADLEFADLSETAARRADFTDARALSAVFDRADLTEATFDRADLSSAGLRDATLVRASLQDAQMTQAVLTGADLSGADLSGANLAEARLVGATIDLVTFDDANLSGADFSNVSGMDTALGVGAWAWGDRQPRNMPLGATLAVTLCDPGADEALRRAHRIAVSSGEAGRGRPASC